MNLMSRDPERVLEAEQLLQLKHDKGCAVCAMRDLRALAVGGLACSVPGCFPSPKFCNNWQLDEGEMHGNSDEAA